MEPLGLYIHIPFCKQKCHYCAFTSFPVFEEQTVEVYVRRLIEEIHHWEGTSAQIRSVYFGGGTPSVIPPEYIGLIVHALEKVFGFSFLDATLEKTIEVNPGLALKERLSVYHDLGFNRLSMGLQTAQNDLLQKIGRVYRCHEFDQAVQAAEAIGFKNLSADVLFGLPGQRVADVADTIRHLLTFPMIKHISCYSLKVEPGTIFDQLDQKGQLILPSEEEEREMYYTLIHRLSDAGFRQYEISNFALPGFESRHNSAYWDLTSYLGFGLDAASYYRGIRWTNTADLERYCSERDPEAIIEEKIIPTIAETRGEFMFLGLRRSRGVDDWDYYRRFGRSFFSDYGEEIDDLIRKGLLNRSQRRLFLTPRGMDLANQVFMAFV